MSSAALPRIFVTVPGVEDLEGVIVLLRAADDEITDQHREFVIEGPLTPRRAAAVWRLSQHRDHNSEGNQLTLRIDPGGAAGPQRRQPRVVGAATATAAGDVDPPAGQGYPGGRA